MSITVTDSPADTNGEFTSVGPANQPDELQQYLKFHMFPDLTALCPVSSVVELVNLAPSQIVPIPHLPEAVCGIYNWRGEILWMLDLGCMISGHSIHSQKQRNYSTVIISDREQSRGEQAPTTAPTAVKNLGLIVQSVSDMEWCSPDLIQSPPAATIDRQILKFSQGYWVNATDDMLMVLDIRSLFAELPSAAI